MGLEWRKKGGRESARNKKRGEGRNKSRGQKEGRSGQAEMQGKGMRMRGERRTGKENIGKEEGKEVGGTYRDKQWVSRRMGKACSSRSEK